MSQQGSGFDMSKLSSADKIVLGAAGLYFIWVFLPFWYSCCSIAGFSADVGSVNGFRGVLIIAWLMSVVALAEIIVTRIGGTNLNLPMTRGQIHLGAAGLALLFTLLGLVAKTTGLTLGFGIFVAVLIAAAWTYGAYMMYSQPEAPSGGAMGGTMGDGTPS